MSRPKPQKLYCYVDETGQDTQGDLFIVSVVLTGAERNRAVQVCEHIEAATGKGRLKWIQTRYDRRVAYIRQVLHEPLFKGKLRFAIYRDTKAYLPVTIETIARAIAAHTSKAKVTVLIDGLPRSREKAVGSHLRRQRVSTRKVRGVRKDETDSLIRLTDARCGFVRAALAGQETMRALFEQGKRRGYLRELGGK